MSILNSLKVGGAVIAMGLAVAFYHRGNEIEKLNQLQKTLHEQLQQQEKAYIDLQKNLEIERQAIISQKVINNEIQQKRDQSLQQVRTIIKTQPCSAVAIDKRVLDRLRQ